MADTNYAVAPGEYLAEWMEEHGRDRSYVADLMVIEPGPLTVDEMQASGNKIAKELRGVSILAAQAGMSERIFKDRWNINDIRSIRQQARLAALRWNEVDALATEILDQVERAKKGSADD